MENLKSAICNRRRLFDIQPPVAKYQDLIAGDDALPVLTGCAWVVGDGITSQQVLADDLLGLEVAAARARVLAAVHPEWAAHVRPGDFLVAGLDFAGNATHRGVAAALKSVGLGALIARSFGRFFVRHAIHIGLPPLVVEETAAIKAGDHLRVDIEAHVVANLSSGDRYVVRNIDDEALEILRARKP